ncbi:MAG TPA: NADH-quinone oxidoreductase subunit G [Rhizobiales bacterium]|nr:NADH-quinone oxidoreductase chain 3 [bacterium BMS3Bbin10]HDO52420.1 NADH-quinone oxidoreductase subunit G [Hyphomicrobiales bacterium]
MPKLIIDGAEIEVEDGITLIQACEEAGVEIPRFCYHERLSVAGNCRMCLVEVAGMPKPIASCALGVNDLRPGPNGEPPEIITKSKTVKKAREGVMEFLLINHPLDCPICDQGGECDLQDQAMAYGVDGSRFKENKRAVEDKYIGPLIKTIMNRCIHCTRCVRFMTEVAGVEELGMAGRGEDVEITTYLEQGMMSEMSGNVIDLCPVGALTSKPYAFAARPWELRKTESIDVMDAMGANIRVDTRGREVMRILPRNHDEINEEWISDKSRFIWDGLRTQRLDQPYVRVRGKLRTATWDEAFAAIARKLNRAKGSRIAALAGDLAGAEEMFALKDLMTRLGSPNIDCRQDGAAIDPAKGRGGYLFNSGLGGIDTADALLLIGCNPRTEATVLNARIRRRWSSGQLKVGLIGPEADLSYRYDYIGAGPQSLADVASGKHPFAKVLKSAKRPMLILGAAALAHSGGGAVMAHAARLADMTGMAGEAWNGFNVLHHAASRVAGLDMGVLPAKGGLDTQAILKAAKAGKLDVVYLLGADEIDMASLGNAFVIYQGTHGDAGAHRADVILPGAAYTEKSAIYVNTEGRPQMTDRAIFPPGDAREDWAIIRALSAVLGKTLDWDALSEVRDAIFAAHPHLAMIDEVVGDGGFDLKKLARGSARIGKQPFGRAVDDFYLSNPIARASAVMGELSAMTAGGTSGATGTDG